MSTDNTVKARVVEQDHFRVPYGHLSDEKQEVLRAVITAIVGHRFTSSWAYLVQVEEEE